MTTVQFIAVSATLLLTPAFAADVQIRVINYLPTEVSGQPQQTAGASAAPAPLKIVSNGSAVSETAPGSTWVFRSGGTELKRYSVKADPIQTVVLGERPLIERTLINETSVVVQVSAIFGSDDSPPRLMQQPLFDLQPGEAQKKPFYDGNVLRFEEKAEDATPLSANKSAADVRVAPDYLVRAAGQDGTYRIIAVVARTVHNYLDSPVDIHFFDSAPSGTAPREAETVRASRQLPLLVTPGWTLSFRQGDRQVREDYVVSTHKSGDINLASSADLTPTNPARPSTPSSPGAPNDDDPDWKNWIAETGPYLTFPPEDPLDKSPTLFGHYFPGIDHCVVGYNVLRMDPRDLQNQKGTQRRQLFEPLKKGDTNWRVDTSEAAGVLLPNYLRVIPDIGGQSEQTRFVYMSESEHMNSWTASLGIIAKGANVGASFNHSKSTQKSNTQMRNQDFTLHWRDWAVINKPEIQLEPEFARRLLALRNADEKTFEQFFEEYGTHYPVATLFGGIRSDWGETEIVQSRVSETTGWNVGIGPKDPKKAENGLSASLGNSTTDASGTSQTSGRGGSNSTGTLDNDRAASVPIRVILAPISELVRPQLLKGSQLGTLRAEFDAAYESYRKRLTGAEAPIHRVFRVVARCQALSNDDAGDVFEIRGSSAHLYYSDLSDTATPVFMDGYPRQILSNSIDGDDREIKPGEDIVNDVSNIVVGSQHALDSNRLAAVFDIWESDDTKWDRMSHALPASAYNSLMGHSAQRAASTWLIEGWSIPAIEEQFGKYDPKQLGAALTKDGISLRSAMELRTWTEKLRALSAADDRIRTIETTRPTDSAAAGTPAAVFYDDPERDRIVDSRTLDERISRATGKGLTEYLEALRKIKELNPLCRQQADKFESGIGTLRFSLQVADVTHVNPTGIRFPDPPIANAHALVDQTEEFDRDAR